MFDKFYIGYRSEAYDIELEQRIHFVQHTAYLQLFTEGDLISHEGYIHIGSR